MAHGYDFLLDFALAIWDFQLQLHPAVPRLTCKSTNRAGDGVGRRHVPLSTIACSSPAPLNTALYEEPSDFERIECLLTDSVGVTGTLAVAS
jgi:hypothetical protein